MKILETLTKFLFFVTTIKIIVFSKKITARVLEVIEFQELSHIKELGIVGIKSKFVRFVCDNRNMDFVISGKSGEISNEFSNLSKKSLPEEAVRGGGNEIVWQDSRQRSSKNFKFRTIAFEALYQLVDKNTITSSKVVGFELTSS